MNELSVTVDQNNIEFDQPINVSTICLNNIVMYSKFYNLATETIYTPPANAADKSTVKIPPGYYTEEDINTKTREDFDIDYNTLKVKMKGSVTGGLKKIISKNGEIYLTPLCFYLYVDGIDTSKNLLNGKRSKLLSIIPITKDAIGEIISFQTKSYKKLYGGTRNSLSINIFDEYGKEYNGKFVAEFIFVNK